MTTLSVPHKSFKLLLFLVGLFAVGLFFGVLASDGSTFRSVWVNSYLKMHSSLDPSENTDQLVVIHNNISALLDLMEIHSSIVEINETKFYSHVHASNI